MHPELCALSTCAEHLTRKCLVFFIKKKAVTSARSESSALRLPYGVTTPLVECSAHFNVALPGEQKQILLLCEKQVL